MCGMDGVNRELAAVLRVELGERAGAAAEKRVVAEHADAGVENVLSRRDRLAEEPLRPHVPAHRDHGDRQRDDEQRDDPAGHRQRRPDAQSPEASSRLLDRPVAADGRNTDDS